MAVLVEPSIPQIDIGNTLVGCDIYMVRRRDRVAEVEEGYILQGRGQVGRGRRDGPSHRATASHHSYRYGITDRLFGRLQAMRDPVIK